MAWLTSNDYTNLLTILARNRKTIEKLFKSLEVNLLVAYEKAKRALIIFIRTELKEESEEWKLD